MSPDGKIVWWSDPKGDEWGRWMFTRFDGGDPMPLVPDIDDAWSSGFSLTRGRAAFGQATEGDYAIFVVDDDQAPRLVYRHEEVAGVGHLLPEGTGGISADGSLVCIRHSELGDVIHPALRVLDAASGKPVAELSDPGRALSPIAWAPSEPLLLFTSERGDFERPAIRDLVGDERRDLVTSRSGTSKESRGRTRQAAHPIARAHQPGSWPASIWTEEQIRPYVPTSYSFCSPFAEPTRVLALLPEPARDLLGAGYAKTDGDGSPQPTCSRITTEEARALANTEGNVVTSFPSEGWGISWSRDSTRVAVWVHWGGEPWTIGVYDDGSSDAIPQSPVFTRLPDLRGSGGE